MLFLIEYNRRAGHTVSLEEFDDSEGRTVQDARLEDELDLFRKGVDHDVVILQAESKEALRLTHGRYGTL